MKDIRKLICAGFGGQGVVLLGEMIGFTGVLEGRNYGGHPSYGPEMRQGTCNYKVVLSEKNPSKPKISSILPANQDDLDLLIAFTIPSMNKFLSLKHDKSLESGKFKAPKLRPGGLCFYNTHAIATKDLPERNDINLYGIPVTDPTVFGKHAKQANMIMFGAVIEGTKNYDFIKLETVIEKTLPSFLKDEKANYIPANIEAINLGAEYFKKNYGK
ncbi:hypothetical protein FJZ53_00360 [Candidatus Woesearchaeota archaeon]|nr:hypothetical protein [Candidatus Woesearchaeota archaeon]